MMKTILFLSFTTLTCLFYSCEKPTIETVTGNEATIGWQDCAYFVNEGLTVCFMGASEARCPCNCGCFWEGAVDATLRVTNQSGVEKTITLTTNCSPEKLHNSEVVDGKTIRFVSDEVDFCKDYAKYKKYKVTISVE